MNVPILLVKKLRFRFVQDHISKKIQIVFQVCVSMMFNFMDHNLIRKVSHYYGYLEVFKMLIAINND